MFRFFLYMMPMTTRHMIAPIIEPMMMPAFAPVDRAAADSDDALVFEKGEVDG
jgi:hypothetical protein